MITYYCNCGAILRGNGAKASHRKKHERDGTWEPSFEKRAKDPTKHGFLTRDQFDKLHRAHDCDFRDAHDAATDTPTGTRCGEPATCRIEWEDGRYSFACGAHTEIEEHATVKPSRIVPLDAKESE